MNSLKDMHKMELINFSRSSQRTTLHQIKVLKPLTSAVGAEAGQRSGCRLGLGHASVHVHANAHGSAGSADHGRVLCRVGRHVSGHVVVVGPDVHVRKQVHVRGHGLCHGSVHDPESAHDDHGIFHDRVNVHDLHRHRLRERKTNSSRVQTFWVVNGSKLDLI